MPKRNKGKGKSKATKKPSKPSGDDKKIPLDKLVFKLCDLSVPVQGYSPEKTKLEANITGKGRGYLATCPIAPGVLLHRSSGYICSPSKMKTFDGVPEDKQLSVNLLSQIVEQMEDPSYPNPRLHKGMKEVLLTELQPQQLKDWHGKQTKESEFIAELFCKATKRSTEEIEFFSRLGLVAVVNSHQVQYEFGQTISQDWGIFPSASFINHSCWPNCTAFYSSKHKEFWIQSIRDIKEGEELTINYVSLYLPRRERNAKLRVQYEFECACEKCLRVDENSTLNRIDEYLEAFRCPKGESCQGVVLWEINDENLQLRCHQCDFASSELVEEYQNVEKDIQERVHRLQTEQSVEEMKEHLEAVEALINNYFHPYNSYTYQVKNARAKFHKYCAAVDYNPNGPNSDPLEARIANLMQLANALKDLNKFCLLIYPKYHPQRAHILLDLGNVLSVLDRAKEGTKYLNQGRQILEICRGPAIAKDQLRQLFATGH